MTMAENPEVKEIESLTVTEFCEFLETRFDQEVMETLEKNKSVVLSSF